MLIYLGVGLAVTTMCIDLAGIQYIQKIHYFGRKFRGADLLQLLKRKRMIERSMALGHCDEILQIYFQSLQDGRFGICKKFFKIIQKSSGIIFVSFVLHFVSSLFDLKINSFFFQKS